jgi:hypothetical protein
MTPTSCREPYYVTREYANRCGVLVRRAVSVGVASYLDDELAATQMV